VTSPSADRSAARAASKRSSTDERSYRALEVEVLSSVREHADELAVRWEAQVKSVALMDDAPAGRVGDEGPARRFVIAMLGALSSDDREAEEAIACGLQFGSDAFGRGTSLHHTMKALDLLSAMTLYAVQTAIDEMDGREATASQGIRLARQLQRRAALLSLAATRGYMQAYAEALRERFRHLRHDLRNPLGTIKSVLALMDDESVPPDARADPRFQAMAKRNARSLEELIADRLRDAAALLPIVPSQDVSLRSIACAVRRELRNETERHGVTVLVGTNSPFGRIDAPGLELLLRGALQAILQECAEGDQLQVDFGDPVGEVATVSITCESGRPPLEDDGSLARLTALARRMGASVSTGERVLLAVPMRVTDGSGVTVSVVEPERPLPRGAVNLGDLDARDDVRGARQREHGQSGAH
jgi:signal transduction histidine kinase